MTWGTMRPMITHQNCRLCNLAYMKPIFDLGKQPLQGQFPFPDDPDPPSFPVEVCFCPQCGLVQSRHSVDPVSQFTNYYYRSSVSDTMRSHLAGLGQQVHEMIGSPKKTNILDIGGNDGFTLDAWPIREGKRIVVDPCDVPLAYDGINKVQGFFPQDFMLTSKFDVILTVACFYDVDRPVEFAKAVKNVLAPNGVWVVEVADLRSVMNANSYDYFVHEHVTLFSPFTMTRVAQDAELRIVRMERNGSNGGSIRFFLTHRTSPAFRDHPDEGKWNQQIGLEWSDGERMVKEQDIYTRWKSRINTSKNNLIEVVHEYGRKGKIHLLGASTKLNVVLHVCRLDMKTIEAGSDRDPRKIGRVTPGTRIPIISEEESRKRMPALYLTSLNMFRKELIARERSVGNHTPICFVLPQPDVV